jgi:teichuronic acid biosynthesis glycosyltransferase TuaG
MTDLISVIMPVYNAEKFVSEAINSVVNQRYPHWELLIINDGSQDRSSDIIAAYTDKRIRYFRQANKGVSAARNLGLAEMSGSFFCFLDADDVFPSDSLEARLAIFRADKNVHFVDGTVRVFDARLQTLLRVWQPSFQGNPLKTLVRLEGKCFFGPTWMVRVKPGTLYRMDEGLSHGEDLLFYSSIAQQGQYSYTAACILHYRKNSGSAMSNLEGLARGYSLLRKKLSVIPGYNISLQDKLLLQYKTRRIMFLSFLRTGKLLRALQYLVTGKI